MDPQQPQPQQQETAQNQSKVLELLKNKKFLIIALGILLLLSLIIIAVIFFTSDAQEDASEQDNQDSQSAQQTINTPYTIVYGTWTGNQTEINSYNIETKDHFNLATLPLNIKKVSFGSNNELVYIGGTDSADHGQNISATSLETGDTRIIYNALDGYGIDDYQISPNGEYIATWEVILSEEGFLLGGRSRVVAFSLTDPTTTHTIIEQVANQPVLYPLAVTDTGRVFMDRFLPNSGAGWAYGMATSNYDGTAFQDISSMPNGTYGTQPRLSPDGQLLVFAGYTGPDGTQDVGGFRKALVSPDAIQTLDTTSLEKSTLSNLPTSYKYVEAQWNSDSEIAYTRISTTPGETGPYIYDTLTNTSTKIQEGEAEVALQEVAPNKVIYGKISTSFDNAIGNLGPTYSTPYTELTIKENDTTETLPLAANMIQVISITQNTSDQAGVFSIMNTSYEMVREDRRISPDDSENLRLDTIEFKEKLEPTREAQQSDPIPEPEPEPNPTDPPQETDEDEPIGLKPADDDDPDPQPTQAPTGNKQKCENLVNQQCGSKPTPATICDDQGCRGNPDAIAWNECKSAVIDKGKSAECSDSPLYLYGPEGLAVDVKIHTPIFNANAPHTNGNYSFTLGKKGLFSSGGKSYESLSFDYTPQRSLRPPFYGKVVKSAQVEEVVKEYAKELGLNTRETYDLVKDLQTKATSSYVFISFYDQKASKYLLPMSFRPQPNTYINYVFYIKNLHSPRQLGYTPNEPVFPTPEKRGKFTAVEISVISD